MQIVLWFICEKCEYLSQISGGETITESMKSDGCSKDFIKAVKALCKFYCSKATSYNMQLILMRFKLCGINIFSAFYNYPQVFASGNINIYILYFSAGTMNKGPSHYADEIKNNLSPNNKELVNTLIARSEVGRRLQNPTHSVEVLDLEHSFIWSLPNND